MPRYAFVHQMGQFLSSGPVIQLFSQNDLKLVKIITYIFKRPECFYVGLRPHSQSFPLI